MLIFTKFVVMLVHYVTFLFPGAFMSEESTEHIKSREGRLVVPEGAFAYYFWDRTEFWEGEELLTGGQKNVSGRFYPEGNIYTKDEIKKQEGESSTLYRNMKGSYKYVIKSRRGNWQPFDEKKDKIV